MTHAEYDRALTNAQGDADAMLVACVQRITTLTLAKVKAVAGLRNPIDTGNSMTCAYQIGREDMQRCKLGNDTSRACCCYHSGSLTQIIDELEAS